MSIGYSSAGVRSVALVRFSVSFGCPTCIIYGVLGGEEGRGGGDL